jgi:hypothetical protein
MYMKKGFIYITTNTITGKKYIGKKYYYYSNGKESNWRTYLGSSKLLKKDIDLFGDANFSREIIDEAETEEGLALLEKYYIDKADAVFNDGYYNLSNSVDKFFTTEDSIKRMLKTRERWSDEKRASVSDKMKQSWADTYEQRCNSIREYQANRTDKQRCDFRKSRSKTQKKVWASYSEDKKSKIAEQRSELNKQYWQSLSEQQKQEHHKKRKGALEKAWETTRKKAIEFSEKEVILINVKTGDEMVMSVKCIKLKYGIPHNTILSLLKGNYSTHNLYKRTWTLQDLT